MNNTVFTSLLIILGVVTFSPRVHSQDQKLPAVCKDSSECGVNECCRMGHYSGTEPGCVPAPVEDEACRPGHQPVNTSVYDIQGNIRYNVTNVYTNVCPCGQGLTCDANSGGVCKKSA